MTDSPRDPRPSSDDSPSPDPPAASPTGATLPVAEIQPEPRGWWRVLADQLGFSHTRMWWLTAASLLIALLLTASAWRSAGTVVTIEFSEGHGIQPGDAVRLRGIDVGLVERVKLNPDLDRVLITARLVPESSGLAREGTQFWIERPRLAIGAIQGLDTVMGPKYIGVHPGPAGGKAQKRFVGVEAPRQLVDGGKRSLALRFRQGNGIQVGSPVRFRGVQVGEVVEVALSPDGTEVTVRVELAGGATSLAREGSQFWIERPRVDVAAVRGLETILTGPYVAVLPGPLGGVPVEQLVGLEAPPAESESTGGIEITIESNDRTGLETGSPLTYRGVTIGRVAHVGLSSDAASVEARVAIEPTYRDVVRDNSKFWATSGMEVQLGLSGVKVETESLATLAAGGLAMATPDEVGRPVASGHRFRLEPRADPRWLEWSPHLAVGARVLPDHEPLVLGTRGTFSWKRRSWGVTRWRQQSTWVHAISDGQLLCSLVLDEPDVVPPELKLEIEGQSIAIEAQRLQRRGALAAIAGVPAPAGVAVWDEERLRAPQAPEDCVLVAGTNSIAVAASRLTPSRGTWLVDSSVPLGEEWNGAATVARSDGALVGIVVWHDDAATIAPWRP